MLFPKGIGNDESTWGGKLYLWGWFIGGVYATETCLRKWDVREAVRDRRASLTSRLLLNPPLSKSWKQILTLCGLRSSACDVLQINFILVLIGIWKLGSVEAAHVFVTCCFLLHLRHCRNPGELKRPRRMRKTMAECSALGRHSFGL